MEESKTQMVYRYLGNSGLKVSVLSYGNWLTAHDPESEEGIKKCIKRAYEHGINFFDTAEIYGAGVAETIMGQAFKEMDVERSDLVVSTKFVKCGDGINDSMLSRKHLTEAIQNSLKRLQLDYVDVVFCHRPDSDTALEETCRAMDWMIEEGYAFYWATSEWSPTKIGQAVEICTRLGLHKPIGDQLQYSALVRDNFEKNFRPVFEDYHYGTTIWSPLAGGLLSGKYNEGTAPPGSRYADNAFAKNNIWPRYFGDETKDKTVKALKTLGEVAADFGCSQAQLCLAWCIVNRDVSTCIFGATTTDQVDDNIKAIDIAAKWTPEIENKINEALANTPEADMDWNTWNKLTPRRELAVDYSFGPEGGSALMAAAAKHFKKDDK